MSRLNELDLTVFENSFDPHRRGLTTIRAIKGIEANKHPRLVGKLSKENSATLWQYAQRMIERVQEDNLTVPSVEKNLSEAWKFCLAMGNKDVLHLTSKNVEVWWQEQLKRYRAKQISYGTLAKLIGCTNTFLKYAKAPKKWGTGAAKKVIVEAMQEVCMPNKPKAQLRERLPTQAEVKWLLDALYVDGSRMSVRNRAICSLLNDTGCRISEALSICNKHFRPEKNYIVIDLPHSKTAPRTVIAALSRKHLEAWARISPNRLKGKEAYFFCQADGSAVTYASVVKEFKKALKKTKINWQRGVHYFRHLFISRAADWPSNPRLYWCGLRLPGHQETYSHLTYENCIEPYFAMLKKEKNPMAGEEAIFWENENEMGEKAAEILNVLTGNPKLLKLMAEALNKDKKGVEVMNLG